MRIDNELWRNYSMTKTELIQGVQEKLNCTKKDAELAVNTVFEVLTDALVHDEKVAISNRQQQKRLLQHRQRKLLAGKRLYLPYSLQARN